MQCWVVDDDALPSWQHYVSDSPHQFTLHL
jgi:hypothetical protein